MNGTMPPYLETAIRLALVSLFAFTCWSVLQPFLPAMLFALAITVSTWPAYRWLRERLGGRRTLASLLACLIVGFAVIAPAVMVVLSLFDAVSWLAGLVDEWRGSGTVPIPAWLSKLPLVGQALSAWLADLASGQHRMAEMLSGLADPLRRATLAGGRALGSGVGQGLLAAVLLFFMYRDGDSLAWRAQALARRVGGETALDLLATAQRTISGVMFSVIGTALAQAMVATLGFSIVEIPNAGLLGAITFVLSMAPIGPPLIWGGATLWLLRNGDTGRAIFMGLYGLLGISSVDNIIKPFLISRSSHLPFALTFMGAIGGVLAFGVAGVFIGPTALALAIRLGENKLAPAASGDQEAAGPSRHTGTRRIESD